MNFHELGAKAAQGETYNRPIVKGRELQYDADFACYEVADLEKPLSHNFRNLLTHIEIKRVMAGAETVVAHITLGTKTAREKMATVKEYQAKRDRENPIGPRVNELRAMLANHPLGSHDLLYEADDKMVQRQHLRIKAHGWESTVIMSGDKDLWMGMGWHCDPKTGAMYLVKGYGKTEYRDVGNVKLKMVGEGTSWFWHQMVMGDKVDNIPGLEKIHNSTLDEILPLASGKARKEGTGKCGEGKAYELLRGVADNKTAAALVYEAYRRVYGRDTQERLFEQGYLLWMQRNDSPRDVLAFFESCGLNIMPSKQQLQVLMDFETELAEREE